MAVSNLPTRNEIHQPILTLLSDGKEHRCSFAMQDLKAEDLVESPRRGYWKITKRGNDRQNRQNRITPRKKETRENTQRAPSKTLPSYVSQTLHAPNLIRRNSMKDKKLIIRTHSRIRSYGKKLAAVCDHLYSQESTQHLRLPLYH